MCCDTEHCICKISKIHFICKLKPNIQAWNKKKFLTAKSWNQSSITLIHKIRATDHKIFLPESFWLHFSDTQTIIKYWRKRSTWKYVLVSVQKYTSVVTEYREVVCNDKRLVWPYVRVIHFHPASHPSRQSKSKSKIKSLSRELTSARLASGLTRELETNEGMLGLWSWQDNISGTLC